MPVIQFDARTVQPAVGTEPVPDAWYKVVVNKTNIKTTKAGDGGFLELQLQIIEGQFAQRIIYWNLNLWNPSAQAVDIAYKQLSAICYVTGQFQVQSNDGATDNVVPNLHNIPFMAHAVVVQGNQGPMNNVRAVKDLQGNDPGKQGGASMQQPAAVTAQPGGWTPNVQQVGPQPNQPPANFQPPQQQGAPAWQPPQGGPQPATFTPPGPAPSGPSWSPPPAGGGPQPNAQPNPQPNAPAWSPQQAGGATPPWQR